MVIAIAKMSKNGRVVIPVEIRRETGLKPGMKLLVFSKSGNIILQKVTEQQIKAGLDRLMAEEKRKA